MHFIKFQDSFQAGIDNDHLILALEPVAASIYCHELRLDFDRRENKFLPLITPGMKLMVIDLGGIFLFYLTTHISHLFGQ